MSKSWTALLVSLIVASGMAGLPASATDTDGTINPYTCGEHTAANYMTVNRTVGFGSGTTVLLLNVHKNAAVGAGAGVVADLNIDARDKYFQDLIVAFNAQNISDLQMASLGVCYTDSNNRQHSKELDFLSRSVKITRTSVEGWLEATTDFGLPKNVIVTRVRVALTKGTVSPEGHMRVGLIEVTTKREVNQPSALESPAPACPQLCP